jgi:antitoxin ParD1/3/4
MKSTTTTLNISLPKPLKTFVEEQTKAEGYTSSSEYIRELIRAARRHRVRTQHLETLLLEGLDSGTCIEADDSYWTAKERKLLERWGELEKER